MVEEAVAMRNHTVEGCLPSVDSGAFGVHLPQVATVPVQVNPHHARWRKLAGPLTVLATACADILAILVMWGLSLGAVVMLQGRGSPLAVAGHALLAAGLLLMGFKIKGLYPGVALGPVDEIRRAVSAVLWATLLVGSSGAMVFGIGPVACGTALAAPGSVFLVLLARTVVRIVCARYRWWGKTALVVGAGHNAKRLASLMRSRPTIGLRPAMVMERRCEDALLQDTEDAERVVSVARHHGASYVVACVPYKRRDDALQWLSAAANGLLKVIVVPEEHLFSNLWVHKRRHGLLRPRLRERVALPLMRLSKRAFDIIVSLGAAILFAPVLAMAMAAIRLTSPGPLFYGHERIGRNGRRIKAWKLRTMVQDADLVLQEYLRDHPELREAWERDHKLKNDPRITSVGAFLRRTSLDELPQLLNVLRGEMSIVGPRPIVDAEVSRYGSSFYHYSRAIPGLTGLWQVSGRNDLSYSERVRLDTYYVCNWSPWLDLHILARTVWVILAGQGAY